MSNEKWKVRCTWVSKSCSWLLFHSHRASRCAAHTSWHSGHPFHTEGERKATEMVNALYLYGTVLDMMTTQTHLAMADIQYILCQLKLTCKSQLGLSSSYFLITLRERLLMALSCYLLISNMFSSTNGLIKKSLKVMYNKGYTSIIHSL